MSPHSERGFTLTELAVVMILAALVTVGLVTFYLNSQAMWIDASTQSMVQRDATLLLERMTRQGRVSLGASVISDPDSLHQTLILHADAAGAIESARFWWDEGDSLVHFGTQSVPDRGPVTGSKVKRFQLDTDGDVVYVKNLEMVSTSGQPVQLTSIIRLYNRIPSGS